MTDGGWWVCLWLDEKNSGHCRLPFRELELRPFLVTHRMVGEEEVRSGALEREAGCVGFRRRLWVTQWVTAMIIYFVLEWTDWADQRACLLGFMMIHIVKPEEVFESCLEGAKARTKTDRLGRFISFKRRPESSMVGWRRGQQEYKYGWNLPEGEIDTTRLRWLLL